MSEAIAQLIQFLKDASPMVWHTLIVQVYHEAAADVFWGIVFCVPSIYLLRYVRTWDKTHDEYSDNENRNWAALFSAVLGLIAVAFWASAVMWFSNPEFYAIRFLLEKLSGQS